MEKAIILDEADLRRIASDHLNRRGYDVQGSSVYGSGCRLAVCVAASDTIPRNPYDFPPVTSADHELMVHTIEVFQDEERTEWISIWSLIGRANLDPDRARQILVAGNGQLYDVKEDHNHGSTFVRLHQHQPPKKPPRKRKGVKR